MGNAWSPYLPKGFARPLLSCQGHTFCSREGKRGCRLQVTQERLQEGLTSFRQYFLCFLLLSDAFGEFPFPKLPGSLFFEVFHDGTSEVTHRYFRQHPPGDTGQLRVDDVHGSWRGGMFISV